MVKNRAANRIHQKNENQNNNSDSNNNEWNLMNMHRNIYEKQNIKKVVRLDSEQGNEINLSKKTRNISNNTIKFLKKQQIKRRTNLRG